MNLLPESLSGHTFQIWYPQSRFFLPRRHYVKVLLFTVQLIISLIFVACCRVKFRILITNVFLRNVKF